MYDRDHFSGSKRVNIKTCGGLPNFGQNQARNKVRILYYSFWD